VKRLLPILVLLTLASLVRAGEDPRVNARRLADLCDGVRASIDSTDEKATHDRWDAFNDTWLKVEDPIRALSPGLYRKIEEGMQDVTGALPRKGAWHPDEARLALAGVRSACLEVAVLPAGVPTTASATLSLGDFVASVTSARILAARDPQAAFDRANDDWFKVEKRVSALDRSAYVSCESALAEARSAARARDGGRIGAALERIRATVEPLAREDDHVGTIATALILLREGAEALLVLSAIAAFLGRIGAGAKARLVWMGGALGLLASLVGGALLFWFFAGVAAGERREVVEGISSLVAAVLLVVVGQWLHEKIRRGGWKTKVQEAHESGRTLSLLLVAFIAVFREGAETVVFLAGLAPSSTPHEMATGVALGLGALAAIGVGILALGRRVPMAPFLTFATALLWALAVKFAGDGVVALQAGGVVSATRFAPLPAVPLLGFAPTLESAGAQLVLVLVWVGFSLKHRLRRTPWRRRPEFSSIEA
jgi:high-affinity iron transporter